MNWIKENKFLTGFLIVLLLGVGALGYLIWGAKGRADTAQETYQRKMSELNRLQRLPTFPNQQNLDKIVAQQTEVNEEVSKLASSLGAQQMALEDMTPELFQDKLKAAATALRNKAAQTSPPVALGELKDKFFLGFERYETAPPPKEAAAALGRELKVIEWLCTQLIEKRVAQIKKVEREDLPEEKGRVRVGKKGAPVRAAATPVPAKGPPGKGGAPAKEAVKHDVEKHRIDLVFVADQGKFRSLLNAIVGYKGQFLIPQVIHVKNEKLTPPSKVVASADAAPPPPETPPATPAAPGQPVAPTPAPPSLSSTNYIVGEEKIEVTMVVYMVDFTTEDSTPATPAPK